MLGPAGLLAGVIGGGKKTLHVVSVVFTDGRKVLVECSPDNLKSILALSMKTEDAPAKSSKGMGGLVVIPVALGLLIAVFLVLEYRNGSDPPDEEEGYTDTPTESSQEIAARLMNPGEEELAQLAKSVKKSDEYEKYSETFQQAAREMLSTGRCIISDFVEMGGFTRASKDGQRKKARKGVVSLREITGLISCVWFLRRSTRSVRRVRMVRGGAASRSQVPDGADCSRRQSVRSTWRWSVHCRNARARTDGCRQACPPCPSARSLGAREHG